MSIEFEGLDEVFESLDNIASQESVETALFKACALVERTARQKAPKVDGELRRSITSKIDKVGSDISGVVYTPLHYAPYVEYGTGLFAEGGKGRKEVPWVYVEGSTKTSTKKTIYANQQEAEESAAYLREKKGLDAVVTYGMKPQPYMRPALNENREKIKKILKEGIMGND